MAKDPYKYFRVEARELVDELTHVVLEVGKGTADGSAVAKLLRLAHTLKGAVQSHDMVYSLSRDILYSFG